MFKKLFAAILALSAAMAFAAVDANKATQAELEAIKGIGPAIATKIIDERKKGSFKDWQDMVDRVKGVGEGNAAKFSTEGLTVNGSAFAGAPAKPAAAKKEDKPAAKAEAKKDAAPAAATPAPAAKADAKPAAMSADDKKAAAKKEKEDKKAAAAKEKEDKKAAKAAKAEEAKKAKADKAAAAKAAKEAKATAAAAPASAAKK